MIIPYIDASFPSSLVHLRFRLTLSAERKMSWPEEPENLIAPSS